MKLISEKVGNRDFVTLMWVTPNIVGSKILKRSIILVLLPVFTEDTVFGVSNKIK